MQVTYDARTDTLTIVFNEAQVVESDEDKPGVILDYDESGSVVAMEILDASRRVREPNRIVYELVDSQV